MKTFIKLIDAFTALAIISDITARLSQCTLWLYQLT